jgi:Type IV secretion-system coupling protein DNA-binding domain
VTHEAEALTLATSLFPDKPHENTFFVEGPRKIFAHLLTLKPTPEELVRWMSHEEELDRLLKGTELSAFIYRGAGPQRGGVLGALNMVADSLKLLPKEGETKQRWTTEEWARQRSGWIFLTSTPRFRERLLPLMSLWLDTLVLRLMNQGDPSLRHAWFVLDELASLQRLPQLHTALTENRARTSQRRDVLLFSSSCISLIFSGRVKAPNAPGVGTSGNTLTTIFPTARFMSPPNLHFIPAISTTASTLGTRICVIGAGRRPSDNPRAPVRRAAGSHLESCVRSSGRRRAQNRQVPMPPFFEDQDVVKSGGV